MAGNRELGFLDQLKFDIPIQTDRNILVYQ